MTRGEADGSLLFYFREKYKLFYGKELINYDLIYNCIDGIGLTGCYRINYHWCGGRCNAASIRRCDRIRIHHHADRKAFQEKEEVSPVTGTPSFSSK